MAKFKRKKSRERRNVIDEAPHRITGGHVIPDLSDEALERESTAELMAILQISACHDVGSLHTQRTLRYIDPDGVEREYSADLTAQLKDIEILIEVKPLVRLLEPDTRTFYAMVARSLQQTGRRLDFITEEQLLVTPRNDTATFLKRYRSHPIADSILAWIQAQLAAGPATIQDLLARPGSEATLADLYAAISQRKAWIDWNRPLSVEATIALPHSGFGGLSYEQIHYSGRHGLVLEELVLGGGPEADRLLAAEKARRKRLSRPADLGFF